MKYWLTWTMRWSGVAFETSWPHWRLKTTLFVDENGEIGEERLMGAAVIASDPQEAVRIVECSCRGAQQDVMIHIRERPDSWCPFNPLFKKLDWMTWPEVTAKKNAAAEVGTNVGSIRIDRELGALHRRAILRSLEGVALVKYTIGSTALIATTVS